MLRNLTPSGRLLGLAAMLIASLAQAGCGHNIGDSCQVSSDCASDGTRVCDTFSPGGSCTIQGCDFGTCPDESVCVRFFPALENAPQCRTTTPACGPDQTCTVDNKCAPRSIELRFCMPTCGGHGDCRDGYECRDRPLMQSHGGEPVPDPTSEDLVIPDTKFCASRRPCSNQSECDSGEVCDLGTRICLPG